MAKSYCTIKFYSNFPINEYSNQVYYSNSNTRDNVFDGYCSNREGVDLYKNIASPNKTSMSFRLETNYKNAMNYNYGVVIEDNKRYYFFINNVEWSSNLITATFSCEVDWWQTYCYNVEFKKSFVEREHVTDDTFGLHTLDENLPISDYLINDYNIIKADKDDYFFRFCVVLSDNKYIYGAYKVGDKRNRLSLFTQTSKGINIQTLTLSFANGDLARQAIDIMINNNLQDSIIGTIALDNEIPEELEEEFSNINIITESKTEPAKEVIVGMSPDLVVGRAATFIDDRYGTIESLNSMNINVYTQLASLMNGEQSLDNIFEDIKNVGKIFNVEDKANTLATELSESLKSVEDKVSTLEGEPLKVLVMTAYNDGSYNVFGANSTLQNEILEVLGGTNVNEKGGAQSLENLMSLNPDVILYVYNNKNLETDSVAVESLYNNSLIQSVPAIENKKVFEVSYTEFMGYGYRTIECIENLAKEMYPELFK